MRYENLVRLDQYEKKWRIMTAHLLEDDDEQEQYIEGI